jgi:mycoredoxin
MMRRWGPSAAMLLCGLVLGAAQLVGGSAGTGAAMLVFFVVVAAVLSPRAFPRSVTDAQARESSARDGRPIVYWRPGCPFCMRLRASLGRDARRLHWVDIWHDPAGAATVRGVTGGDETVPTVVAADGSYVNPAPALVRDLVRPA